MSNGSEHTPERCVHAVDGPDWAGLREPASWKERAIAAEAENVQLRGDLSENRRALDDAINVANGNKTARDALQAENEKHRADLHEWETVGAPAWVAAKDAQIAEVWAGRDALQARLDAMTTESRFHRLAVDGKGASFRVGLWRSSVWWVRGLRYRKETRMPDNWTPSTEQVRSHYVFDQSNRWDRERGEAFDRWLAEHDREVAAQAWDEGESDGAWNYEHAAMIERGNREAIVNPYRSGAEGAV